MKLDTPQHHVMNGNTLLASEKIDVAFYEFNRARELDPEYAPAYMGLGLVEAYRGDFASGLETLKTARRHVRGDDQKRSLSVAHMRVYILGGERIDKDWLKRVEEEFSAARIGGSDDPELYYYMGIAYKSSLKFAKASEQFKIVHQLNKGFSSKAERELALIQKIEKAMPGSTYGKKIAILEQITRAEAAALFIKELIVHEAYVSKSPQKSVPPDKNLEKMKEAGPDAGVALATDIDDHALKAEINAVIEIGIKGLQPFPDGTYRPNQTVSRAEFAVMLEDILIRILGSEKIGNRISGVASPFWDVDKNAPYFKAVMTCTTRNVMTTEGARTRKFDPMGPVSGIDALLSIRALKSQL